jgi:hypothetical protein
MDRFSSAFDLERKRVAVDPLRFQGRQGEFAEDTVNAIVNKGKYDRNADEIIVWRDPSNENYYVISGHSRWEAARQLFESGKQPDLITIPVKEYEGDEEDAIDFATIESNRGSTEEGLKSDLEAYRRAVSRGFNTKRLMAAFKPKTRLFKLRDLSFLNPKGPFTQYLGTESEKHFPYIERNARWVGVLRDQMPLTNEHEQEIFNFFYKENEAGQKLSKDQFFKIINDKVNRIDFDADAPLNLKNRVSSNALTDPITEQIKDLDRQIEKLNREAGQKRESIARAKSEGLIDVVPKLQSRISDINKITLRLTEEKQALKQKSGRIEASAVDLFSDSTPAPEKKEQMVPKKPFIPPVSNKETTDIKARIKKRANEMDEYRPEKKFKVGELVNVHIDGSRYEGLPVSSVEWDEGNWLNTSVWEYWVTLPNGKTKSTRKHRIEKFDSKTHKKGLETNPYPILDPDRTIYATASKAWQNQSFGSESRGERFMESEENTLREFKSEFTETAAKNDTMNLLSSELTIFLTKYRKFVLEYLYKEASIVSTMIAGPANFPVARMEKKRDSARKTYNTWVEWTNKAAKSITKTLKNEPGISGDPRDELTRQKKKLEGMLETREMYKEVNKAYRAFKKKPETLDANNELSESGKTMIRNWKPKYGYEKSPIAPYQFQNLGANIKRVEGRVQEIGAKAEIANSGGLPVRKFEGGQIIYNAADNRIQIDFDDKPDVEIRNEVKKAGFKWAPSVKFWQRAITDNALRSTAYLSFLKYEGEYRDIFKNAKREEKEVIKTPPKKDIQEQYQQVTDNLNNLLEEDEKLVNSAVEGPGFTKYTGDKHRTNLKKIDKLKQNKERIRRNLIERSAVRAAIDTSIDYFDEWEKQPKVVSSILEKYPQEGIDFPLMEKLKKELAKVGWTFEYDREGNMWDLVPIPLDKIQLAPRNLTNDAKNLRKFVAEKFGNSYKVKTVTSRTVQSNSHILIERKNGNEPIGKDIEKWFKNLIDDSTVGGYGIVVYVGMMNRVLDAIMPDKTKRIRLAKAKAAALTMLFEFKQAAA